MVTTELRTTSRERFMDLLIEKMTPQVILGFHASEEEVERVQELIERNNAGTITPEEAAQLDQIVQFELFMTVLKTRAMKALKAS